MRGSEHLSSAPADAKKPVRVALVSPLWEAVPPKLYGGTERVVGYLAEALVELGHDVTLFGSGDGSTRARLVATRDQAIRLDANPLKSDVAAHLSMLHEVRRRIDDFDVVHFHTDMLHFPFFEDVAGRTLTTVHGRLDLADLPGAYRRWPDYPLASISNSQRAPLRFANWMATVYHGLPENLYRFTAAPSGRHLAFLGRISPEKRPDRAIAIARRAGIPLKIAAKVDGGDVAYFHDVIKPLIKGPLVEFVGEINDREKCELLGDAIALLFPIEWPEPFGLVMIEAMACGTPVIATGCGSVPEIVEDGVTGCIVSSESAAVAAIERAAGLNRFGVRREFERRFSSLGMANNYLRLYRRLASGAAATDGLRSVG